MEAVGRIDKDRTKEKGGYFPVIVIVGSLAAEGSQVMDRDFQQLLQRIQKNAVTVHVVMYSSPGLAASTSGQVQTEVGSAASKQSGGRYDAIAAASRVATLLPEIGQQIARSAARESHQYRVTFERPGGASGTPGQIQLAVPSGLEAALSIDGHLP
jgi:hypothetical protein